MVNVRAGRSDDGGQLGISVEEEQRALPRPPFERLELACEALSEMMAAGDDAVPNHVEARWEYEGAARRASRVFVVKQAPVGVEREKWTRMMRTRPSGR